MAPTYNLFISHGWSFDDSFYRILDYLDKISNNYEDFTYYNSAEPEPENAPDLSYTKELKVEYSNQIDNAEAIILLADLYKTPKPDESNYMFWLDYALEHAKENNKPVIGIRPWNEKQTPQDIQDATDIWVDWNPESIKKTIEKIVG